ncbi:MAG TPA: prolipoprotein diacylglyceryl transferase family protein [Opitutaceae bacterium]|nr:prolipoprotein diacylglyceryl transferase family protein [Opitutaceae bacterium]
MKFTPGKVLYGFGFCAVLPALLILWAVRLDAKYPMLPPIAQWPWGAGLIVAGGALMLRAMWELWRWGGGLPMNAYPPPRLVTTGLYGWLPHPIYGGFGLLMLGVFLTAGSRAGGWVVSPVLGLGMTALVIGYERVDLQRRFGAARPAPRLALPPNAAEKPRWWHRLAAYLLVLAPWLAAYEAIAQFQGGGSGVETYLPFERAWRPLAWTGAFYAAAYAWVALAPFAATSQAALRRFVRDGWIGSAVIFWSFLAFPFTAPPRPLHDASWFGQLLAFDRAHDTAFCALPSFHVFWPFLAARLWAARFGAPAAYGLAAAMAASCVTTGMHSLADVVAGFAVFVAVDRIEGLWNGLLRLTETVANSWHDWRLGPVRVINHGAYVGAAAAGGLWLVGTLLGPEQDAAIVAVACCSLLGAGIWAQLLESSSGLSRPFGYYGSIFGGCFGALIVQLWQGKGWMLWGAFAAAAPLIQGVGRLRCLVQGCCHGRPCPDHLGIRYVQPLSRVCKMAHWAGRPVYPTPLYSIIGNVAIFGLLLRLWFDRADLALVVGAYFILSACARFIEEAYRGEPQTPRPGGLAIYQWLAILLLIAGAAVTTLSGAAAPPVAAFSLQPLRYALPFGLLVWFAMGVDFPASNRRFSRLA